MQLGLLFLFRQFVYLKGKGNTWVWMAVYGLSLRRALDHLVLQSLRIIPVSASLLSASQALPSSAPSSELAPFPALNPTHSSNSEMQHGAQWQRANVTLLMPSLSAKGGSVET